MKRDTEIIRDILFWLLDDPSSTPASLPGGAPQGAGLEDTLFDSGDSWDPFESEALSIADLDPKLLSPGFNPDPVSLGEIPVVQDRFQALIKRRLRMEIERRPPLFPWEKEVQDYPEWLTQNATMGAPVWLSHLRALKLPTVLPDAVMTTLLERCQTLAQQSLMSGIRLVKAVETLFPEQPQMLENVARLVLTPAYRSGGQAAASLNLDYASANVQQQAALAMMAAQEIFNTLSLALSPQVPEAQQQWLTTAGLLTLTACYLPGAPGQIRVQATVPQAGYLQVGKLGQAIKTERTQPGELLLQLDLPAEGQTYLVEVGLEAFEDDPLQFTLSWLDD